MPISLQWIAIFWEGKRTGIWEFWTARVAHLEWTLLTKKGPSGWKIANMTMMTYVPAGHGLERSFCWLDYIFNPCLDYECCVSYGFMMLETFLIWVSLFLSVSLSLPLWVVTSLCSTGHMDHVVSSVYGLLFATVFLSLYEEQYVEVSVSMSISDWSSLLCC